MTDIRISQGSMRDANMKVLQNFLFLLEDADFDFEEDLGELNNCLTILNWQLLIQ